MPGPKSTSKPNDISTPVQPDRDIGKFRKCLGLIEVDPKQGIAGGSSGSDGRVYPSVSTAIDRVAHEHGEPTVLVNRIVADIGHLIGFVNSWTEAKQISEQLKDKGVDIAGMSGFWVPALRKFPDIPEATVTVSQSFRFRGDIDGEIGFWRSWF